MRIDSIDRCMMHVYVALRNHKLLWLSWVEAHGFPTLRFFKASIINSEVNWNVWCSWKVLWKFLESFPESYPYIYIYPSYLSVRNPRVMDLLSLPMEVPMPRIPWMAINHHDIMRSGRVLGHSNGGISKSFLVHVGMRKWDCPTFVL